jgi:hypothetical protein
VGFLLGGAAVLFRRIWLQLVVLIGVLSAVTWLLAHYSAT